MKNTTTKHLKLKAMENKKEEPKNICIQTGLPCGMQCLSEETCNMIKHKQETLEEVAERILSLEDLDLSDYDKRHIINAMVNIAKWQQQQNKNLYSEEEVIAFGEFIFKHSLLTHTRGVKSLFEQFKKK